MELLLKPLQKTVYIFYYLTLYQWQKIEETYKKEKDFDKKFIWVIICTVIVLILSRYFCKSANFIDWSNGFYKSWTYPDLYPKLYWAVVTGVNYLILPCIVIKFIFKEKIRDYGFHLDKKPKILLLYFMMFAIVIPLAFLASFQQSFLSKYPIYYNVGSSWIELAAWEAGYGFQFITLEFFFRGFLLFTLARYIGAYAIFVMVIPYTMIHFSKPLLETCGAIITGIALGTLALRTKSIYGGIIIHIAIAWSMDFFVLYQRGVLARLLNF